MTSRHPLTILADFEALQRFRSMNDRCPAGWSTLRADDLKTVLAIELGDAGLVQLQLIYGSATEEELLECINALIRR